MRRSIIGVAAFIAVAAAMAGPSSAQPGAAGSLSSLRQEAAPRTDVEAVHWRRRHHRRGFGLFLPGFSLYVGPRYRYRHYEPYYYGSSYYYGGPYLYPRHHYRRHHIRRHHFRRHHYRGPFRRH